MERRHFLKLAFGFAAGGIALAASAQAAPLMPAPLARRQTARQSRCPTRRHVGRGGRSPHAGGSALGPRPSSRLGPPALGLAPPPLASPALGLASPPSLAPPLLASSSLLLVNRRQDCLERIKKAPRERGFCLALEISISAAASVAPHGAIRAAATGTYHHNRRRHHTRRHDHNCPANGLASAVGTASPARAASLRGFRWDEAGNGAQGQNCCEKVLHVVSRS